MARRTLVATFLVVFLAFSLLVSLPIEFARANPDTLTLRPNADGTYSQFVEVPNSGFIFGNQFESGGTTLWTAEVDTGNIGAVASDYAHHGTYSYKIIETTTSQVCYLKETVSTQTTLYVRFYFMINATISGNYKYFTLCTFLAGTTRIVQWDIWTDGSGKMSLRYQRWYPSYSQRNAVNIGLSANTWYYFDMIYKKDASAGMYSFNFNGATTDSETGLDTSGAGDLTNIYVGTFNGANDHAKTMWFDCVVFSNSADIGAENRPTLVNDQSDNTALQVTASTTQKQTLNLADSGHTTETISSVTAYCRAKGSVITDTLVFVWRTYSNDYETTVPLTLTTSFAEYSEAKTTNPNTGNAWTWTEVDALELGSRTPTNAAGDTTQFSEYWIVVTYSSGAAPQSYVEDSSANAAHSNILIIIWNAILNSASSSTHTGNNYQQWGATDTPAANSAHSDGTLLSWEAILNSLLNPTHSGDNTLNWNASSNVAANGEHSGSPLVNWGAVLDFTLGAAHSGDVFAVAAAYVGVAFEVVITAMARHIAAAIVPATAFDIMVSPIMQLAGLSFMLAAAALILAVARRRS